MTCFEYSLPASVLKYMGFNESGDFLRYSTKFYAERHHIALTPCFLLTSYIFVLQYVVRANNWKRKYLREIARLFEALVRGGCPVVYWGLGQT